MRKNLYLLLCVLLSFPAFAQSNYALSFNGTSNYVSIGTPVSNGSSYTKEAWVYLNSATGARNIISSQNTPLWLDNGILKGGQNGTYDVVIDPTAFPLNTWTHVAITYTAGSNALRLYRDGVQVASGTTSSTYSAEGTYIGSHYGTASYFSGSIDEVRIWNTALSQVQIKQNMLKSPAANASGLLAYYSCNGGSGTVLANNCTNGTGSNGVINGAAWVSSPVQYNGNALNFDGTDDYVTVGKPLSAGSSYTKEAWVYATKSTAVPCNIISSANSPLWVASNRLRAGNNGPAADIIDNTDFPTNTWVHVAVSYDATTSSMRLYRNGILVASGTGTTGYLNETNYIGAWYNTATPSTESYWGGHIDEVRIWNTVRSQSQIQANMYNELDVTNTLQNANLVAYYTFNQGATTGTNTGVSTLYDQKNSYNGTLKNFALSGATSNFVLQQNAMYVLPVKWLSFTAKVQNGKAILDWQTEEEAVTAGYTVQHSTNGSQWVDAGRVQASGNGGAHAYQFTHNGIQQGANYYRLALQEKGGKTTYSETRILNVFAETPSIKVLGNSVRSSLSVEVLKPCVLSLYDQTGKRMLQLAVKPGMQQINVSNFPRGIYLLNSGEKTEKLMLQ